MAKSCRRCHKNGRFQRNLPQVPVLHKCVPHANCVGGVVKVWNLRWNLPQVPPSKMTKSRGRCPKFYRFQRALPQDPAVHTHVARANCMGGVLNFWNLRWNLPQVPPSKKASRLMVVNGCYMRGSEF